MPFRPSILPDELVLECCRKLVERSQNAGSWKNGLPECFIKACTYFPGLAEYTNWLSTVEAAVANQAIHMLVELSDKAPKSDWDAADGMFHRGPLHLPENT